MRLVPEDGQLAKTRIDDRAVYYYKAGVAGRPFPVVSDMNPWFLRRLLGILRERKSEVIQVEFPWGVTSAWLLNSLKRRQALLVYDAHNCQKRLQLRLFHIYARRGRLSWDALLSLLIFWYTALIEPLAVKLADLVVCVSTRDKELLFAEYAVIPSKLIVAPNGVIVVSRRSPSRDGKMARSDSQKIRMVFHGPYGYPPNREAIDLIVDYIAPNVEAQLADAEFVVVGKDLPIQATRSNVRFLGFVPDLNSLLRSCDIALAPLVSGEGTRLKVLDYLAAGLPLVATTKAVEGLEIKNSVHALILDRVDEDFVNAIVHLARDSEERRWLGENAERLARERYGWKAIAGELVAEYQKGLRRKQVG